MSWSSVSPSGPRRRPPVLRAAVYLAAVTLIGSFITGSAWGAPPQAPGAAGPASLSLKELTRSSDYVFRGTVVKPGAANLEVVEPSARTAVVRVEEVLKASPTIDDFTGRDVTVILDAPGAFNLGERQVFFGTVGLAGESLGILALGRAPDGERLKVRVARAQAQLFEDALKAKLEAADLAIDGRILSTRSTYADLKDRPLTEHDPFWWEAQLEVKAVLQGQTLQGKVPFWYPTSIDAMWAPAPKPAPGNEGVWLLHRFEVEGRGFVYAVLNPGDQLTAAEAQAAQKWVKP